MTTLLTTSETGDHDRDERGGGDGRPGHRRHRERAWIVLALATITAGLTGPGQTIGVAVFIDHFVEDLALSRSQVSAAYLVGTLAGAALLPWVGRFVDRRGVRIAQVAVGLLFAAALVNMSLVGGLVWLAVGFTGIRLLGQGSLTLVATVTVSLRFARRRGTALGLFSMGTAALMALVPVGLAIAISTVGWRAAWLVSAAVVVLVVVPIGWFGLRTVPGGTATRALAGQAARSGTATLEDASYDRGEALTTRAFWVLAAVSGTAGMMVTALNFHQIDLMGQAGISATAAATLFVPQVLGSTVAGVVVGHVGDRYGSRWLPAACTVALIAAQLLAAAVTPGVVAVVYAIVLGATGGAVRTATSSMLPSWFGTGHLGSIHGALTFFGVAASALGPVALAVAERAAGGYGPAVVVLLVLPVAALLVALLPVGDLRPVVGPAASAAPEPSPGS